MAAYIGYGLVAQVSDASPATTPTNTIQQVTSFTPPNPTRDMVDVTSASSPNSAREFIPGMIDYGEAGFEIIWDPGSTTDVLLRSMAAESKPRTWKVTYGQATGSPTVTFAGFLTGYEKGAPVEDKLTATLTIKVTGAPVFT